MEGLVDELVLERLALADVARVEHEAADARVVEQVRDRHLRRAQLPGAVAHLQLDDAHGVGLDAAWLERSRAAARRRRVEQVGERLTGERLGRVAEDPLDRLALVHDDAVRVDDRDDVGAVLDERLEPLLARPQLGVARRPGPRGAGQRHVLEQRQDLPADEQRR